MANIQSSPLYDEVLPFLNNVVNHSRTNKAIVYGQGGPFVAWKVKYINRDRDYENSVADITRVCISVGIGDYAYKIYPARSSIEIVLHRTIGDSIPSQERFMAFMDTEKAPKITASSMAGMDAETLNLNGFVDIEFELWNPNVFKVKNTRIKGGYQNKTGKSLIEQIFDREVAAKTSIKSLIMEPPNNTSVRQNMVIYDGVKLTSLPTYIQNTLGGLYNYNVGTYIQKYKNTYSMFVYPLYKTNRFEETSDRIMFIVTQDPTLVQIENTYMKVGNTTKILITGNVTYSDKADNLFEDSGAGFRLARASAMMTKPVSIKGKEVKGISYDMAKKETTTSVGSRAANTPNASRVISDNPYIERSKLTYRKGAIMMLEWQNSNDEIIYPGEPCRILMSVNGDIACLNGVILSIETVESLQGVIAASSVYGSVSLVKLFVSKDDLIASIRNKGTHNAIEAEIT